MNNNDKLIALGLSSTEANAYVTLLQLGGSLASSVARAMNVKRTTMYALLQSMASKGFVTVFFKKNKRYYYAQKPHKLTQIFESKITAFNEIVPFLESLDKKQVQMLGLRFIETTQELRKFYDEILIDYRGKEYCAIGNANAWEGVDKEFITDYRIRRAKNKIKTKLLLTNDSDKINNTLDKSLQRDYKFLPKKYTFKSTMDIFDDKVLIVSPELSALAVVISIPAMIDIFKGIFNIIWDYTKPIK